MRRSSILFSAMLVMALFLAACGGNANQNNGVANDGLNADGLNQGDQLATQDPLLEETEPLAGDLDATATLSLTESPETGAVDDLATETPAPAAGSR